VKRWVPSVVKGWMVFLYSIFKVFKGKLLLEYSKNKELDAINGQSLYYIHSFLKIIIFKQIPPKTPGSMVWIICGSNIPTLNHGQILPLNFPRLLTFGVMPVSWRETQETFGVGL